MKGNRERQEVDVMARGRSGRQHLDTASTMPQMTKSRRKVKGSSKRQEIKALAKGRSRGQQRMAELTFKVMARTSTKSKGRALREPVSAMKSPCKAVFQLKSTCMLI